MPSDDEIRPDENAESEEEEGGPVKPFLDHLEDLRWVLIKSGSALAIGMAVCMAAAPFLVDILTRPLKLALIAAGEGPEVSFFGPIAAIVSSMRIAFYGGIMLGLPFILYFIGDFVFPALKKKEKRYLGMAFTVGTGLFIAGVLICYFFVLSLSLRGMIGYAQWLNLPANQWRAEEYFQFVIALMMGMGISFELPVLLLTLVKLGLMPHDWLVKGRRYFFFANFVVCAFITPDFLSTFFLVIPTQILLEICIWISKGWEKQRLAEEAKFAAEDSKQLS